MSFRIQALPMSAFADLFQLSDDALRDRGALRRVVDKKPGFPCRVSLVDAEIGETVLLVHYEHQSARTPFRASHAVYVRENAVQAQCATAGITSFTFGTANALLPNTKVRTDRRQYRFVGGLKG